MMPSLYFCPHSARDAAGEAAAVLRYPRGAALGGPGDGQGGAQEAPRRDGTQVEGVGGWEIFFIEGNPKSLAHHLGGGLVPYLNPRVLTAKCRNLKN